MKKNVKEEFSKETYQDKVTYAQPPDFITCPKCGWYIELWTDTEDTSCLFCGFEAFQNSRTVH